MSIVDFLFYTGFDKSCLFNVTIKDSNGIVYYDDVCGNNLCIKLPCNKLYSIKVIPKNYLVPNIINAVFKTNQDYINIKYVFRRCEFNKKRLHKVSIILVDSNYFDLPIEKGVVILGNL